MVILRVLSIVILRVIYKVIFFNTLITFCDIAHLESIGQAFIKPSRGHQARKGANMGLSTK